MGLLAHPCAISDAKKSLLIMNFEGYGMLNSRHRNSILGFQQDESGDL